VRKGGCQQEGSESGKALRARVRDRTQAEGRSMTNFKSNLKLEVRPAGTMKWTRKLQYD
jgi:hypothetical protein